MRLLLEQELRRQSCLSRPWPRALEPMNNWIALPEPSIISDEQKCQAMVVNNSRQNTPSLPACLWFDQFFWVRDKLPKADNFPARTLLVFSLPLFASALVTLLQGWGDIALLQAILGKLITTGAYYIVVTSI